MENVGACVFVEPVVVVVAAAVRNWALRYVWFHCMAPPYARYIHTGTYIQVLLVYGSQRLRYLCKAATYFTF